MDASTISSDANKCLELFTRLSTSLNSTPSGPAHLDIDFETTKQTTEDARARFRAWGTNIAAFHSSEVRTSLDSRLKEAPGIRNRTMQVLTDLREYLTDATFIISGMKVNLVWSPAESSNSSDSSEGEKSDTEEEGDEETTSSLQELLKAIIASISSLMKLSILIRSSPNRDDYIKAASRYNTWSSYPDIGHVREKYGHAKYSESWLLDRLGRTITRRRQFLKYRVEHHEKMTVEKQDIEKPEGPAMTVIASTKATTFVGQGSIAINISNPISEAGSFGSLTSYDPTVFGMDGAPTLLTVPSPPKYAFPDVEFVYGDPFQCPYCFTEQIVKNKSAWKKHVFRDLKPYVCTFEGCAMLMFKSRKEWFEHEMRIHRREWCCQFCECDPFPTKELFSMHTTSAHSSILASSSLEALQLQSEEEVERILATACHLCNDWEADLRRKDASRNSQSPTSNSNIYGQPKQFCRHLGRHMEQMALFALPQNGSDDGLDDDSSQDEASEIEEEPSDAVSDTATKERDSHIPVREKIINDNSFIEWTERLPPSLMVSLRSTMDAAITAEAQLDILHAAYSDTPTSLGCVIREVIVFKNVINNNESTFPDLYGSTVAQDFPIANAVALFEKATLVLHGLIGTATYQIRQWEMHGTQLAAQLTDQQSVTMMNFGQQLIDIATEIVALRESPKNPTKQEGQTAIDATTPFQPDERAETRLDAHRRWHYQALSEFEDLDFPVSDDRLFAAVWRVAREEGEFATFVHFNLVQKEVANIKTKSNKSDKPVSEWYRRNADMENSDLYYNPFNCHECGNDNEHTLESSECTRCGHKMCSECSALKRPKLEITENLDENLVLVSSKSRSSSSIHSSTSEHETPVQRRRRWRRDAIDEAMRTHQVSDLSRLNDLAMENMKRYKVEEGDAATNTELMVNLHIDIDKEITRAEKIRKEREGANESNVDLRNEAYAASPTEPSLHGGSVANINSEFPSETRRQDRPAIISSGVSTEQVSPLMGDRDAPGNTDYYNPQDLNSSGGVPVQPGQPGENYALQDYEMRLMLLDQQNKKRLLMARQEQEGIMTTRSQGPLHMGANIQHFPQDTLLRGTQSLNSTIEKQQRNHEDKERTREHLSTLGHDSNGGNMPGEAEIKSSSFDAEPSLDVAATNVEDSEEEPYIIKCICDLKEDDGNTIYCEKCDTWQHIQCYYFGRQNEALQTDFDHACVNCEPRTLDSPSADRRQDKLLADIKSVSRVRELTSRGKEKQADPVAFSSFPSSSDKIFDTKDTDPSVQSSEFAMENSSALTDAIAELAAVKAYAASEVEQLRQEAEDIRVANEEMAASANLPPDDKPIRFKDAVGRKFSFPFHLCKKWADMDKLIQQAFKHVDYVGLHVRNGHYDLVGPNGEIILKQVWDTVIQPDWEITMHMWPVAEPGSSSRIFADLDNSGRDRPSNTGYRDVRGPGNLNSEQRYATASGTMPRPITEPLVAFNRPGSAFPDVTKMSGTPSDSQVSRSLANLESLMRRLTKEERAKLSFSEDSRNVEDDASLSKQAKLQLVFERTKEISGILATSDNKMAPPLQEDTSDNLDKPYNEEEILPKYNTTSSAVDARDDRTCYVEGCNRKFFSRAADLKRHTAEFHGPMMYCPYEYCSWEGTKRMSTYKKHLKYYHGDSPVSMPEVPEDLATYPQVTTATNEGSLTRVELVKETEVVESDTTSPQAREQLEHSETLRSGSASLEFPRFSIDTAHKPLLGSPRLPIVVHSPGCDHCEEEGFQCEGTHFMTTACLSCARLGLECSSVKLFQSSEIEREAFQNRTQEQVERSLGIVGEELASKQAIESAISAISEHTKRIAAERDLAAEAKQHHFEQTPAISKQTVAEQKQSALPKPLVQGQLDAFEEQVYWKRVREEEHKVAIEAGVPTDENPEIPTDVIRRRAASNIASREMQSAAELAEGLITQSSNDRERSKNLPKEAKHPASYPSAQQEAKSSLVTVESEGGISRVHDEQEGGNGPNAKRVPVSANAAGNRRDEAPNSDIDSTDITNTTSDDELLSLWNETVFPTQKPGDFTFSQSMNHNQRKEGEDEFIFRQMPANLSRQKNDEKPPESTFKGPVHLEQFDTSDQPETSTWGEDDEERPFYEDEAK